MSELREAMAVAAALPAIQKQEIERTAALLYRLPISDVVDIGNAIEKHYAKAANFRAALMKARGEVVRTAEWYVDEEQRCQHRRYAVGNTETAKHGEIGDASWLEAWIA